MEVTRKTDRCVNWLISYPEVGFGYKSSQDSCNL
jgi:hypothetical protein